MSQQRFRYCCRVLAGGTQSFGKYVHPHLIQRWAQAEGLTVAPGSLNVCADRNVEMPETYISLRPYVTTMTPRASQAGFDPRLYPAMLNETVQVWVFRWCGMEYLGDFVGDVDGCSCRQRFEVVAGVHLRSFLGLQQGDEVTLVFQP